MRTSLVALVLSSPLAAVMSLAACVGESANIGVPTNAGDDAATPLPGDGDGDAAPGDDAGGADAATSCDEGRVACGGSCVELASSGENCGACGRSCGGGACRAGTCESAVVRSDIADLHDFDVSGGKLYFTAADKVFSCDVGSCQGTPTQLAAMVTWPTNAISVEKDFFFFGGSPNQNTQRDAVYRCPVAGCANPPSSVANGGLNGLSSFTTAAGSLFADFAGQGIKWIDCTGNECTNRGSLVSSDFGAYAADDKNLYFADENGGGSVLTSAPLTNPTAKTVVTTGRSVAGAIVPTSKTLYFIGPGTVSGGHGVYGCAKTGCSSVTTLIRGSDPVAHLVADDAGVFWAGSGKIFTCVDEVCTGGAREFVPQAPAVGGLALDADFLYFRLADSDPGKSVIHRLRRP